MLGLGRKRARTLDTSSAADVEKRRAPSTEYERPMATIWRNTALSRKEFNKTYGAFLSQVLDYLEPLPHCTVRIEILTLANTALRVRQAHIIPRGIASEDASRLSEVMSFAVVIAVVLEYVHRYVGAFEFETDGAAWCPLLETMPGHTEVIGTREMDPTFALLLMPRLVTEEGLRWLTQEHEALNEILLYFKGDPRSAIAPVLRTARNKLRTADAQDMDLKSLETPERAAESPLTRLSVEPPISSPVQSDASRDRWGAGTASASRHAETQISGAGRPQSPVDGVETPTEGAQRTAKGYLYLLWLRQQLEAGTCVANESTSVVHLIEGRQAFLRIPEAFEAYAQTQNVTSKTVQNQLVRLSQHKIKKGGKDIFVGQDATGRKIPGLVLKDADILWPVNAPAVSTTVITVR